jgi:hypothetical protein
MSGTDAAKRPPLDSGEACLAFIAFMRDPQQFVRLQDRLSR